MCILNKNDFPLINEYKNSNWSGFFNSLKILKSTGIISHVKFDNDVFWLKLITLTGTL